jgi:hypothetical protein
VIFEIVGSHQKSRVSRSDRQVGWLAPRSDTVRHPRSELAKLMLPAQHAAHNLLCFVWQFRSSPIFSHISNIFAFHAEPHQRLSWATRVVRCLPGRGPFLGAETSGGCGSGNHFMLGAMRRVRAGVFACQKQQGGPGHRNLALHLGTHTCASRVRSQVADRQP